MNDANATSTVMKYTSKRGTKIYVPGTTCYTIRQGEPDPREGEDHPEKKEIQDAAGRAAGDDKKL